MLINVKDPFLRFVVLMHVIKFPSLRAVSLTNMKDIVPDGKSIFCCVVFLGDNAS